MHWLRIWFGLSAPVGRKLYLLTGLGLMALRCAGDSLIVFAIAGQSAVSQWHPLLYVAPTLFTKGGVLQMMDTQGTSAQLVLGIMAAWALPFAWVGVSMSVRRARDAGLSPWWGLAFFLPVLNFLAIAVFCALPSKAPSTVSRPTSLSSMGVFRSAMAAVGLSSVFGVVITAISVFLLGDYGWALFVAGPVVIGAIGGWHINHAHYRGYKAGLLVGLVSCILCGGMLIIFAMEGVVCLAMVAPMVLALALMGAVLGTALAHSTEGGAGPVSAMALMVPIIGAGETAAPPPLPVYPVVTEIHIDATPEQVWPNVIGFAELPPPSDWVLKTGIATPQHARIEGEGVGAVRYCVFTTGAFVEPITAWEPPHRLAFDVTSQPEPMQEWSPYEDVYAPHLHDTMMSQRGEFQLIPADGGGTTLRGTTWYTLDLSPSPYWHLWSDAVVHRIHSRVLKHIKGLTEGTRT